MDQEHHHQENLATKRFEEVVESEEEKIEPDSRSRDPDAEIEIEDDESTANAQPISRKTTALSRLSSRLSRKKTNKEALTPDFIPVSDLDSGIVGWDAQDDPDMPLNFPESIKWMLLALLAAISFVSPLASSMFAPGVSFMDETYHNTSTVLSAFVVSVYLLGYTFGPLLLASMSEIYGRRPVLFGANVFFCVWQIGCALAPNLASLIIFRFLAGIGGSGCLTIGGGVIADLFRTEKRGMATAIYSLGPLFGPVVGPICGGFIAARAGWRWIFWVLFIAATITTTGIECFNRETNHSVLMNRKVARLRHELGRPELRSVYDKSGVTISTEAILKNGLLRPLKMLVGSPIVFILSFYMAVVYGLLYLLFTTIDTVVIVRYHWDPQLTGLAYISIGTGFFLGLGAVAKLSDSTVIRMTKANNGVSEPEMRLPACTFFACFIPISFFWYGWTADKGVQWIVPLIGLVPFGFGMMGIFIPIQTYLIDCFPEYAASAIACLTFSRSLFGALLPLAGSPMYAALGLGWGNSLLGFIGLALVPAPALIFKYGKRVRERWPINL